MVTPSIPVPVVLSITLPEMVTLPPVSAFSSSASVVVDFLHDVVTNKTKNTDSKNNNVFFIV